MMHRFALLLLCLHGTFLLRGNEIRDGVLDLRRSDLRDFKIHLDGDWAFEWQALKSQGIAPTDFFKFPELWNNCTTRNGQELSEFGYATYQLTLLLPAERPDLSLYLKHCYSAYALYVNGQLKLSGGEPGTSAQTSKPLWIPGVVDLPQGDSIRLTLLISNFHHRKGGAREPILLGEKAVIDSHFNSLMAFDLLLAGTMIMAGLFFYGLYFFGYKNRSSVFFALFCLTFAYRAIGADNYALQILYPQMSWWLSLRLEYLFLFISPIFFGLSTNEMFPLRYKRINPLYLFAAICGAFTLFTLFAPTTWYTILVEPFLIILILFIVRVGWVYLRAYQQDLDGANFAMYSSGVVLVTFAYNILIYLGFAKEIELISFLGYLFFFLFQSIILFLLFTNDLKRAKEAAENASRTKSNFLSMMSHEIRTPMNAVIGLTNYMLEDKPKKEHQEILGTLRFSAQNLLVIINDILDFSKIEADKITFDPQAVNLKGLATNLERFFQPIAREKGLQLVLEYDEQIPPFVVCDPARTSQVLTNLMGNALKFTHESEVRVAFQLVSVDQQGARISFRVSDTGIGISEENQKYIFESFTQVNNTSDRKYGGTGLGLSITKRLLAMQGVELKLESTLGQGSVFYFEQTFVLSAPSQAEQHIKALPAGDLKGLSILLVEDNEVNVLVASKFILKWGARLQVAKNGEEALQILRTEQFSVILMDLQMPLMDGYEATRRIRSMGIRTPVIALTASALMQEQRRIFQAGMDSFVTKPFEPEVLFQKIMEMSLKE